MFANGSGIGKAHKSTGLSYRAVMLCVLVSIVLFDGCGGSGSSGVPANLNGTWGSKNAELDITAAKVTYTNICGMDTLNGTVTPNGTGDFIITGPEPLNVPNSGHLYIGYVQNRTMHLVIVDPTTNTIRETADLTYGVTGEVQFLGCP